MVQRPPWANGQIYLDSNKVACLSNSIAVPFPAIADIFFNRLISRRTQLGAFAVAVFRFVFIVIKKTATTGCASFARSSALGSPIAAVKVFWLRCTEAQLAHTVPQFAPSIQQPLTLDVTEHVE